MSKELYNPNGDEEKTDEHEKNDEATIKSQASEKKGDVIEGGIICGLSLVLLILGACLNKFGAARWLYTFSFVLAGYEILYSLIVKLCKKALVIAEITILIASVILLYCGKRPCLLRRRRKSGLPRGRAALQDFLKCFVHGTTPSGNGKMVICPACGFGDSAPAAGKAP